MPRRARSAGGGRMTRAAASSIASGRPSRRGQIAATAGALSAVRAKSGRRPARARRRGATAAALAASSASGAELRGSGTGSGGTGYSCSPRRRSGVAAGDEHRQVRAGGEQVGDAAGRRRRPARSCRGRAGAAGRRRAATSRSGERPGRPLADAEGLGDRGRRPGRVASGPARRRRRRRRSRRRQLAAAARARRVLPTPPGPVRVTRRTSGGAAGPRSRPVRCHGPERRQRHRGQRQVGEGVRHSCLSRYLVCGVRGAGHDLFAQA